MRARLGILFGVIVAAGAIFTVANLRSARHTPAARVADRRCRGGCADTAVFRVLPGGAAAGQTAKGTLVTSKGGAVTTTRASGKSCTRSDGLVVALTANQPCVETAGLLIESAATNLFLFSEQLNNAAWTANNSGTTAPVVSTDACTAPDGLDVGESVAFPSITAGQWSQLLQSVSVTSGTAYTSSFYVKGVGAGGTLYLNNQGAVTGDAICSFTSSAFTRCSLTSTAGSTGSGSFVIGINSSVYPSEPVVGAQTVCIGKAQLESQAFPTSYIGPTTGATASRTADFASVASALSGNTFCIGETITPETRATWPQIQAITTTGSGFGGFHVVPSYYNQLSSPTFFSITDSASTNTTYTIGGSTGWTTGAHRILFCDSNGTITGAIDGVAQTSAVVTPGGTGVVSLSNQTVDLVSSFAGGAHYLSDVCVSSKLGVCR